MSEPDLLRRKRATEATLAKYRPLAFDWKKGVTCVHMARFHLLKMGHKVETLPRMRGPIGAKRALAERGWSDVAAMLDAQPGLTRIAPAMMLVGDLAVFPGDEGFDLITVCAGRHKLLGWHQDYWKGLIEVEAPLDMAIGAWRT
jgi:hypothetical protein